MNRRDSVKSLLFATCGLVSLPSWAEGWNKQSLFHLSSFSPAEQEILSSVADTIIPFGNGYGALSVGVDKYLQKLIDNCYEPAARDLVKTQLESLNKKSFTQLDQKQREAVLVALSSSTDKNEKDFFDLIKAETIRGFNTSKEVMLQHHKYKIAPGHYYGCVDVKA